MKKLIILIVALSLLLSGCAGQTGDRERSADETAGECLALASGYAGLDLEDEQALLDFFAGEGKCAVDARCALQMTNPDAVAEYLTAGDGSLEVYQLALDGGFTRYDLRRGEVLITRTAFRGELPVVTSQEKYTLKGAALSERGTLIISFDIPGNPASKYAHDGYIVPCVMLKTIAPDPECTKLCEKYAAPLGYARCNALTCNWSGEDISELSLGSLYERLFYAERGLNLWEDGSGVTVEEFTGETHIPAEDFTALLARYLPVSAELLKALPEYNADGGEFRFSLNTDQAAFDTPQPYAEVTAYSENPDGTIALTVCKVFPDRASDCLCESQLLIMPAADGSFKYISNTVLK